MFRFIAGLVLVLIAPLSQAERLTKNASLVIQSPRISFVGGSRYQSVAVRNIAEVITRFDISIKSLETDPSRPTVNSMLRLGKSFVSLAPDGEEIIGLVFEEPESLADGEYAGELVLTAGQRPTALRNAGAEAEEKLAELVHSQVYSIPIVIRKGDLAASVSMVDRGVERNAEGAWLNINLARSGERSIFGDIKVFGQSAPYRREEVLMLKKAVSVELGEQEKSVMLRVPESLDLYAYPELKIAFKERRRHGGMQEAMLVIPLR